jgi:hypothetical protein
MAGGKDRIQRLVAKQFANQTAVTMTASTEFVGPQITLDGVTPIIMTGTAVTKGINFASVTPAHADADDAFIAVGTWNDTKNISGQAYHFVPIQVNLTSGSSVSADIAAARFRVNTHASTANTLTNVNVLEMRSKLQVAIGSHANLQVSTEVSENIACTGDLLVGYFSLQGDGAITTSNHVNVLEATCVMSSGASGVLNVGHFTMNSTGVTAVNVLKGELVAGTVTSLLNLTRTAGTVTNGILMAGTMTNGIVITGPTALGVSVTLSTLNATTGRVAKFVGSVAAPNHSDGYGAVEVDITASGTYAGYTCASSTWLNVAAAAVPGGNMVCVRNDGIYVPTGITTSSATMIMGGRFHYIDDDGNAPAGLYLFSTNIYSNALTALLHVNAKDDLGWITAACATGAGHIPLFRDISAGTTWYVNVYTS